MTRHKEPARAARDLGMKLAKQLAHYARAEQAEFVKRYGFPLPEEEIIKAAADFLAYKVSQLDSPTREPGSGDPYNGG